MFNFSFILLFILISYGMTQVLVFGSVFDFIRPNKKFFKCAMCMGFWVGIIVFIFLNKIINPEIFLNSIKTFNFWCSAFLMGCLSSGTSYALCSIFGDDGINISHK